MADVKINKAQWDAISSAEQSKITAGLRESGALTAGDRIVGDPDVPAITAETPLAPMWNPLKGVCEAACDVAAAAAIGWCGTNLTGPALAACIAAAEAGRKLCKDRC